jgi:hypothetical protein
MNTGSDYYFDRTSSGMGFVLRQERIGYRLKGLKTEHPSENQGNPIR